MSSTSGVIYIATGNKYIDEAFINARRTKAFLQNHSMLLVTDDLQYSRALNIDNTFDYIQLHDLPMFSYRDKISPLSNLPFDISLFLDSDAFLVSPFQNFLDLSSIFDIAACYSPVRHPPGWSDPLVPTSFPEANTGVLLIKKNPLTSDLIAAWLDLYDTLYASFNQSWDQASFRSVLWDFYSNKNLKFHVLPEEFNIRTTKPWTIGRGSEAHVVHGRFDSVELPSFLNYINGEIDTFRAWSIWLSKFPYTEIRPRYDKTFG